VVVMMVVMTVRGERGTGNDQQEQGSKNKLLHEKNVARDLPGGPSPVSSLQRATAGSSGTNKGVN
jgi:hypothetical protein